MCKLLYGQLLLSHGRFIIVTVYIIINILNTFMFYGIIFNLVNVFCGFEYCFIPLPSITKSNFGKTKCEFYLIIIILK